MSGLRSPSRTDQLNLQTPPYNHLLLQWMRKTGLSLREGTCPDPSRWGRERRKHTAQFLFNSNTGLPSRYDRDDGLRPRFQQMELSMECWICQNMVLFKQSLGT
jgi:hypothetical protein